MGSTCAHSRCCGLCDGVAAVDAPTDVGRPNQVRWWHQWTLDPGYLYLSGRIWHVLFFWAIDQFDTWAPQSSETSIIAVILLNMTCFRHSNSDGIAPLASVPCLFYPYQFLHTGDDGKIVPWIPTQLLHDFDSHFSRFGSWWSKHRASLKDSYGLQNHFPKKAVVSLIYIFWHTSRAKDTHHFFLYANAQLYIDI